MSLENDSGFVGRMDETVEWAHLAAPGHDVNSEGPAPPMRGCVTGVRKRRVRSVGGGDALGALFCHLGFGVRAVRAGRGTSSNILK